MVCGDATRVDIRLFELESDAPKALPLGKPASHQYIRVALIAYKSAVNGPLHSLECDVLIKTICYQSFTKQGAGMFANAQQALDFRKRLLCMIAICICMLSLLVLQLLTVGATS